MIYYSELPDRFKLLEARSSEREILVSGMITFSHSIGEKMKHRYQSFTPFGRQFQSLKRQVYAVWTSVSFPLCQKSCLTWRIMAKNDEYNDEYLCRDFFVGFNFWSKLSFQIPEFRVHWLVLRLNESVILRLFSHLLGFTPPPLT